jgi:hypothetical protein
MDQFSLARWDKYANFVESVRERVGIDAFNCLDLPYFLIVSEQCGPYIAGFCPHTVVVPEVRRMEVSNEYF